MAPPKKKKRAADKKNNDATATATDKKEEHDDDEPLTYFKHWCEERGILFHPSLELRNVVAGGTPPPITDAASPTTTKTKTKTTAAPQSQSQPQQPPPPPPPRHNAVFAAGAVKPGDVLCVIPKAWCLTSRNGSITTVLPQYAMDNLDEAGLILAVMYERAMVWRAGEKGSAFYA